MDSQNQQSPQGENEGNIEVANQQSTPQQPLQLDEWLDPLLVDDEMLELPPNDGFGMVPMGGQVDQQPAQSPIEQQVVQPLAETIVRMDRVMADVVGTDRHEAYWSILDDIYYFLRDHRWTSIQNVRGNFRSRTSIEASYRAAGPPPAYVSPGWPLYEARILSVGKEDIRQLVQDNMLFAFDAFNWAAFMDRFGTLEVTYANLGQTRHIIAGLHAKLALHEQQGVSWDNTKHGAIDQVLRDLVYKNEPEFLTGEEWEKRQKSHQVRTRYGFAQAAFADAPRLPEEETAEVRQLVIDSLNERDIVDKAKHTTKNGERDNHVLVQKRHMSLFNMESTGWKAMRTLRKVSLGMPDIGVFNLDFIFKPYDSFGARLRDFRTLIESSKAAVVNTVETAFMTRYAGRPSSELTTKKWNKAGSDRKATELAFASEARRNQLAAGQVGDARQGDAGQSNATQTNAEQDPQTPLDEDGQGAPLTAAERTNVKDNYVAAGAKRRCISDGEEDERSL